MRNLLILTVTIVTLLSANAKADQVLVYHEGDKVPITVDVQGDLAETQSNPPSYMTIKKNFWLKLTQSGTELSFDGVTYQPYHDLVSNTLMVQPVGQNPAGISVSLTSIIK